MNFAVDRLSDNGADFYNLSPSALEELLESGWGESKYRAVQLYEWVYRRGITDWDKMTNISLTRRVEFARYFSFPETVTRSRQVSVDGTRKYLFELDPGVSVETVLIKQPDRMTLCVSSQIGCGMGCTFCRTGTMGFIKNLSTSQIIRQVLAVMQDSRGSGDMFRNIVFMGMGEPLHNYKNVSEAIKILTAPRGLGIAPRKITVSTVGLVPAIKKMGEDNLEANLAVSLNATTDKVRDKIMPINKRFPLKVLLNTLREFPLRPRRKITIEYVLLAGVNDTEDDLKRLPRILHGIPVKVNLIPYNDNTGLGFKPPERRQVAYWREELTRRGLDTTIRWSKGLDIDAACGQLVVNAEK